MQSITAAVLAVVTIPLVLTACVTGASGAPDEHTASPTATVEAEPTPSPSPEPAAPIEVDPALYTDQSVSGVVFGVGTGDVNCQIRDAWDDPAVPRWGCAVHVIPTWQWEDTEFAEFCEPLESAEVGCRGGLVVRGEEAPTPRRNTDADFGGMQASHVLAAGERITVGDVSCEPVGDAMRCEDASSGHGFTLSVAAIDAW